MKTIYSLLTLAAIGLSQMGGCATTTPSGSTSVADKAASFAQSPAGQALTNTVITVALDGAMQYATSGKIDRHVLTANTLDGAAESLRSLAGTSKDSNPNAIYFAAADGIGVRSISQQVAPLIAENVSKQIEKGAPPDQAIENLATALNTASAKVRRANAGP